MISLLDGLRCAYNSSMKEKTSLELEKENRELKEKIDKVKEYIPILRRACSYELDEKLDNLEEILGDKE